MTPQIGGAEFEIFENTVGDWVRLGLGRTPKRGFCYLIGRGVPEILVARK